MGVLPPLQRHRGRWIVYYIFFFSSLLLHTACCSRINIIINQEEKEAHSRYHNHHHQHQHHNGEYRKASPRPPAGPGSSPPTCRYRCGACSPCVPVPVIIHAGIFVPLDYYPVAWRCKCGDNLFMP